MMYTIYNKSKEKGEQKRMEKLIDLYFYIILCGGYIAAIAAILLFIQGSIYQITKHKINIYKILYNKFKKII